MKVLLMQLQKNTFVNEKTGEVINYARGIIAKKVDTDRKKGYDFDTISIPNSAVDNLIPLISAEKEIDIDVDVVKVKEGQYKMKLASVNGKEL